MAKFLYCVKCMKTVKNVFDHICLLCVMCIKCRSIHDDESDGRFAKCSFCDVMFYSETCLRNHFCHKLNIHDECGECQMSCCQVFKYCTNCCEIVK